MRVFAFLFVIFPLAAAAQTSEVLPGDLELEVSVETAERLPYEQEMILLNIRGLYRRHITNENLEQPDFEGFNWAQLGSDSWTEERLDGQRVKVFERRMAIFPNRSGTIEIGAFTHKLTLTDENDDWFDHQIVSEPLKIQVAPTPVASDWWFPVRSLRITDDWSNAPDQLATGEGVLRIVRLEALGATPEMAPPMPNLTSPSAMIFPHPEKRLVELTPDGPLTHIFWRWTIRPTNDVSTIVEPLSFDYFDTTHNVAREVTITAQRVAYGELTATQAAETSAETIPPSATLPDWRAVLVALAVFLASSLIGIRRIFAISYKRWPSARFLDPLVRQLKRTARRRDIAGTRRVAMELMRRDGSSKRRLDLIDEFDRAVFNPVRPSFDLADFSRRFLRA